MKEKINIELKELNANFLIEYTPGVPFVVPTDYFDSFEDSIKSQLLPSGDSFTTPSGYFDELEKVITSQAEITPKESISVPENYFDGLEARILDKINESEEDILENETPVRSLNLKRSLQLWGSIAAAFVIGFFFFNTSKTKDCITFACLLEQTTFTDDELLNLYDDEIANEFIDDVDFLDDISIEDEEILDYLIDEDFDLQALDNMYEL